jgi:hypothetical protein
VQAAQTDVSQVRALVITQSGSAPEGDLRAAIRLLDHLGLKIRDAEGKLRLVASPEDGAGVITGD